MPFQKSLKQAISHSQFTIKVNMSIGNEQ